MTTQEGLMRRLRRLTDDTGHGYSQSAPGFSEVLSPQVPLPALNISIDGSDPVEIRLGDPSALATGQAIAAVLRAAISAADPARLLLPPTTTTGWQNCSVTFSRQDGYVVRSGSIGSASAIRITPATLTNPATVSDVSTELKLGQSNGGYETTPRTNMADAELGELLDQALQEQANEEGTFWGYDTLPPSRETIVSYRAWASIIDIRLGQAASYYWQKVEAEESHEELIFANYLKLANWLKDKIADMGAELTGGIEVSDASRWDYQSQQYVPIGTHVDKNIVAAIASVVWLNSTTALLEFGEILSTGFHEINVGYRQTTPGVIDRSAYNDSSYAEATKGFVVPSVLSRTLKNGRNTLVKITGLSNFEDYYFAVMAVDVDGIRYFSDETMLLHGA